MTEYQPYLAKSEIRKQSKVATQPNLSFLLVHVIILSTQFFSYFLQHRSNFRLLKCYFNVFNLSLIFLSLIFWRFYYCCKSRFVYIHNLCNNRTLVTMSMVLLLLFCQLPTDFLHTPNSKISIEQRLNAWSKCHSVLGGTRMYRMKECTQRK